MSENILTTLESHPFSGPYVQVVDTWVRQELFEAGHCGDESTSPQLGARFIAGCLRRLRHTNFESLVAGHRMYVNAVRLGDVERAKYAESLMEESLLDPAQLQETFSVEQWAQDLLYDSQQQELERGTIDRRNRFLEVYSRCKVASGLLTQEDVAAAASVSRSTIVAIESGKVKPRFATIQKLARAFKVDASEFAP